MRQPLRVPLGKQCRQAALGCQMLESARGSGCCVLVVCGVWCVVCAVCKINDGFCTRLKGKTGKTTGVLMSKLPQLYERQNYHNSMNNTFIFYTQGSAHHHSKARVDKCKGPKCSDTGTVRLN